MTTLMPDLAEPAFEDAAGQEHQEHQQDQRQHDPDHHRQPLEAGLLPDQQDHRGDGPRPGNQRDRQRKDRRIVALVLFGVVGLSLPAFRAPLEQHVERREEQQHPAGDAKGGHGNADEPQHRLAEGREGDQDQRGGHAGPQRDAAAARGAHALRQRHEERRHADRVDDHEERDEGGDEKGGVHAQAYRGFARGAMARVWRVFEPSRRVAPHRCRTVGTGPPSRPTCHARAVMVSREPKGRPRRTGSAPPLLAKRPGDGAEPFAVSGNSTTLVDGRGPCGFPARGSGSLPQGHLPMSVTIRPLQPGDETEWRALWKAYLEFYDTSVPDHVYASTFGRLTDPESAPSSP